MVVLDSIYSTVIFNDKSPNVIKCSYWIRKRSRWDNLTQNVISEIENLKQPPTSAFFSPCSLVGYQRKRWTCSCACSCECQLKAASLSCVACKAVAWSGIVRRRAREFSARSKHRCPLEGKYGLKLYGYLCWNSEQMKAIQGISFTHFIYHIFHLLHRCFQITIFQISSQMNFKGDISYYFFKRFKRMVPIVVPIVVLKFKEICSHKCTFLHL